VFSFTVQRQAGSGWLAVSAHNTDRINGAETHMASEGALNPAHYGNQPDAGSFNRAHRRWAAQLQQGLHDAPRTASCLSSKPNPSSAAVTMRRQTASEADNAP